MAARRIALVTGGSRGIGAAIAVALARDGFDIWLNYRRDHEAAARVAAQVQAAGGGCRALPFDVADAAAVTAALEPLLKDQTPYAVVNNAGFARDALLFWMSPAEWHEVLAVHLDGFFFVTRTVLNNMLTQRQGRIVNIVSTSGQGGMAGQVSSCTWML